MGVWENIVKEQAEKDVVPLLGQQHSKFAVCGACGDDIKKATRKTVDGREIELSYYERNVGTFEHGTLVYYHEACTVEELD